MKTFGNVDEDSKLRDKQELGYWNFGEARSIELIHAGRVPVTRMAGDKRSDARLGGSHVDKWPQASASGISRPSRVSARSEDAKLLKPGQLVGGDRLDHVAAAFRDDSHLDSCTGRERGTCVEHGSRVQHSLRTHPGCHFRRREVDASGVIIFPSRSTTIFIMSGASIRDG